MKRVFKYPVVLAEVFSIEVPSGARFLSVQEQREGPQMWLLVDDAAPVETRFFTLAGTGHPIHPDFHDAKYLGTFQLEGGSLVFHLFEAVQP